MTDIFGNELSIGDLVAFNPPRYKGLTTGYIIGFGKKMVRIRYVNDWNYDVVNHPPKFFDTSIWPFDIVRKS